MDELIPYQARLVGRESVPTVDGRDLHRFLESDRQFADWVKAQIKRANLTENMDFIIFHNIVKNSERGRPAREYAFTFEACKMIGMMANSQKGHEIRKYFLECEAELHDAKQGHQVKNPMIQQMMSMCVQLDAAQQKAEAAERKAEEANRNALLAMRGQQWVTIRQYVTLYHLERQMPKPLQQQYGRWLAGLCRERGIPVYFQRSQEFDEEGTYWISVIDETLPGWLRRRNGQNGLGLA